MATPPLFHPVLNSNTQLTKPMLLLVTMVPDDSGSITSYGNAAAIRRGHNQQLDVYLENDANILVKTRYLNGHVLFDYSRPEAAVRMDQRNYYPNLMTPLYDESFKVLQDVLASATLFSSQFEVFSITAIMTDGADTSSRLRTSQDVRGVVERMFASGRHLVAGIGVRDGNTDFHRVFLEMGIPEQWIKVLEREEGDIVRGMTQFSQVTSRVVDVNTFRQTTMMGFTNVPSSDSSDSDSGK